MSGRYQVRKVRRDGFSQRYWVNPTREHDDAVIAVVSGDLATAESHEAQKLARKLLQIPSVQELLYRSLVRQYEETKWSNAEPMLFLQHYLSRGYPEAEALLVRLATEPSNWHARVAAITTIATSMDPRAPRLIREVADKAPDDLTAREAIVDLAINLRIKMQNILTTAGITPAREAILGALETLGLALQGRWFVPTLQGEISYILAALNYKRSEFERAAQGQIPDSVEKTLIDGLMSILPIGILTTQAFGQTLDVIKEWGSEYALAKLRSLLSDSLPQQRRGMVINAINEIEHQLKRESG
jgi:hypothetical protein